MSTKNFTSKSFLDLNSAYLDWLMSKTTMSKSEEDKKYPLKVISTAMCHDGEKFYLIVTYERG